MPQSSYDQSRIFQFNLVPPKTKEEIEVLVERDNSILYSFLLVFFAMFIFFILNLLQTFVLEQRITASNTQIQQQESSFSAFDEIKRIRGELITKGELLEPVLKKDIKLTDLLDLGKEIIEDNTNVEITTYSREPSGEFVLVFRIKDVESVAKLIKYLNANEKLVNVFTRVVQKSGEGDSINVTISFSLTNL